MRVNTFFSVVHYIFLFFLICVNALNENCKKNGLPNSTKVKELILCDYDKTIRPVLKEEPLTISTHFLVQSFDFFERRNTITIRGWGVSKWQDEHLYWDPDNYNLKVIILSAKDVWIPDIVVFNANNRASKLLKPSTLCVAFYHKALFCPFPINISGLCKSDFTYWPFDSHNCTIAIESFYHTGDKIDYNGTETGLEILKKYQTKWNIIDYNIKIDPGQYKCCPNITYPSIKLNFIIKRHFSGSIAFILVPFLVLTSMTILAIWLNPKSPERIYISVVNIACHTYFLLNSTWELPPYSNCVPNLILLLRNSQILATIVVIETVVIRQLSNKRGDSPRWLTYFLSAFTNSTFGQIFLYPELYSNNSIKTMDADDGETLVEDKSELKEWNLLESFLDRFCFFLLIFIYIIMFITCIPK